MWNGETSLLFCLFYMYMSIPDFVVLGKSSLPVDCAKRCTWRVLPHNGAVWKMMDHSVRPWKKHGLWAQVQSVLPERVCLQMDCAALGKERIDREKLRPMRLTIWL
jgi:hypothetical protein